MHINIYSDKLSYLVTLPCLKNDIPVICRDNTKLQNTKGIL